MNVNGPDARRPLISPDVGDAVFNVSLGDFRTIYRRMRVVKVTATQIETIDLMKRRTRYWRKNGYQVGNTRARITLVEPSAPAFEAKHEVGKPLPEVTS